MMEDYSDPPMMPLQNPTDGCLCSHKTFGQNLIQTCLSLKRIISIYQNVL